MKYQHYCLSPANNWYGHIGSIWADEIVTEINANPFDSETRTQFKSKGMIVAIIHSTECSWYEVNRNA